MNHNVGLWIDHRQAIVVYFSDKGVNTRAIVSNLEKHVRASGGSRSSTPYGPQDVVAEDRILRKYKHHLNLYYEKIAKAVLQFDSLLIMGPGEAKGELKKFLLKSRPKPVPIITVITKDKMTTPQIIAEVKRQYS